MRQAAFIAPDDMIERRWMAVLKQRGSVSMLAIPAINRASVTGTFKRVRRNSICSERSQYSTRLPDKCVVTDCLHAYVAYQQ